MHNHNVSRDVSRRAQKFTAQTSGQPCAQVTRFLTKPLTNSRTASSQVPKTQINTGLLRILFAQRRMTSPFSRAPRMSAILTSEPATRARKEPIVMTALLRIPDVQKLLKASRSTVYRLVEAGELERVHLGSSARIIDDSVYAFIEKLRTETGDRVNGAQK